MNEFTVKDDIGFRLCVKSWKCTNPDTLNAIEFIQEIKDIDGNVETSSTYQFFMTDDEITTLAQGLTQ
jgi:hypothetical protein